MNNEAFPTTLEQIYGDSGLSDEAYEALLDRSLNPRGAEMLYDKLASLGANHDRRLLDVGCRDAAHTIEIARRFGCEIVGIDPVLDNNDLTAIIIRRWQDHGISLSQYQFPADLELGHDLIDPAQPGQKVDVVYPKIIELVTP